MRHRRVQRLLLRADIAVEAGFREDARECLEEVRRLSPGLPAIGAIERQLDESDGSPLPACGSQLHISPVASTFRRKPFIGRRHLVAVAAFALLGAVAIRTISSTNLRSEDLRVLNLGAPAVEPRRVGIARARARVDTASGEPAILPVVELEPPPPQVAGFRLKAEATPSLGTQIADFRLKAEATRSVERLKAETPRRPPEIRPLEATDDVAAMVAGVSKKVTAIATAAPPPMRDTAIRPAVAPDVAIRGTLSRYAAAYTARDAFAAARVWPGVDRAALQRAFDALASQDVSLGTCRIDISGATAHAVCAGTTTWSARGGRDAERTESRRWTFDLQRAGGDWRIVSVRGRNR